MIEMLAAAILAVSPANPVETEITFQGQGIKLQGVFTAPADAKNLPAILMLPGSGPTDRDGSQPPAFNIAILKQLSDELVKNGYATFRFDKRPVARYRDQWPKDIPAINAFFSYPNHEADVVAAFETMKKRPEVDPAKLFVLGHSEGGLLALTTAAKTKAHGLILLGSPGRTMDQIIIDQIDAQIANAPMSEEAKTQYKNDHRKAVAAIKEEPAVPANLPAWLQALYNPTTTMIFHGYFNADPIPHATAFPGPVLVANGEFDVQIDAAKDARPLYNALAARPGKKQTLAIVPSASHNFKTIKSKNEPGIEGPVAPALTAAILEFLKSAAK